uniref:G-protein coupled receptors family 1 profile domain-containing protein n=1 Tax=Pelusios castaneus TaxID=367368 RepID=A0A8C8VH27_9SAUR
MSTLNDTKLQNTFFLLTGVPGLEDIHLWISIPICLMYVTSILGNSIILFIIKTDPNLQEPMYIFLSILAVTDLGLSISTMPTTLGVFLFNSREISHNACFAQLFFTHSLTLIQSSVLSCMAFDRFLAIFNPLRYTSILTLPRIAKMGVVSVLKGVILILPFPILLKQYQYCEANILYHSYCLHKEVMTMACSDFRVGNIYGFFLTFFSLGLDFLFIVLSYVMILKTVLSIPSHTKSFKALKTCLSHIFVVLLFYIPGIGLSMVYRFMKNSSPLVQSVLGNVHFLIPPLINPIVYSVKTKSILSSSPAPQNHTPVTGSLLSLLSIPPWSALGQPDNLLVHLGCRSYGFCTTLQLKDQSEKWSLSKSLELNVT